jgi:hypothetical protein
MGQIDLLTYFLGDLGGYVIGMTLTMEHILYSNLPFDLLLG